MPNRRPRRPTLAALCVPLMIAVGCSSTDTPGGDGTHRAAQAVISDQLHNGGTAGFLFLPPMVPRPAQFGDFVPSVEPTVRIDEINAAGTTLRTLATFTTRGKSDQRVEAITTRRPNDRADDPDGYFLVEWDTRRARLSTDARYRVRVMVPAADGGTRELGFADVDVVGTTREFRTVDTVNFAPLLNGDTLEIKFRIDRPAVDQDGDGRFDWQDNCPTVANADQRDTNRNGVGDVCECVGVTCREPDDQCRLAGICDPREGRCSFAVAPDGTPCTIGHANAGCVAGSCDRSTCATGYGDCNGRSRDGCETSTRTLTNCGACGVSCTSGAHSTPTCGTGTCALTCAAGWADANGNRADGCELDVTTNANCGTPGNVCTSSAGSTSTCVSGACSSIVCPAQQANCNTSAADGCEVSLASDPAHCGACQHACAVANATAACAAGACAVGTCNPGFANCDGSAANGCETVPATDTAHCGACGNTCSLANAEPVCAAGACAIGSCAEGYANCDGIAANGCEVALDTSAAHCGACGSACSLSNATAVCAAGACAVGACSTGFANCDGDAATGCETDLSSVTSCGACGVTCASGPHSTPTCGASTCGITCEAGYANCDGVASNGCEVDTTTSGSHCGACGTVCTNATTCQSGACSTAVCSAGHADCNGLLSDGCETTPATDSGHCGACGNACSFANAAPVCTEGSCGFTVCDMGYADCDGTQANGCEIALGNDASNCGGCGTRCTYAHATGVCGASVCALGACDAGWANCDGNPANGCEVSLTSDLAHCGACATACDVPANATATCGGATCGYTCDATHADCDGNAANGCEVAITTDGANCGACGNACTDGRTCVSGACSATTCTAGLANCDAEESNGCEVSLGSSAAHCGSCQNACSFANAGATCAAGACVMGSCATGYANCDGNPANGCEVAITTDASNCGACGTACTTINGTAACSNGACGVGSCDANFADCDHLAGNGCEVSTATETGNCGACGVVCNDAPSATATCSAGVCGYACAPGQRDCDGNTTNGCEVDANADSANCGGCGVVCTQGRTCQAGSCTTAVCAGGLADCDNDGSNGCEVTLASNAAHCGGCGVACSYTNGTGSCTAGACALATCAPGYANCNASSTDGCEVNLGSSAANCGGCGNTCVVANGTAACFAGACAPAACNTGYTLAGGACVDVNECATNNGNCAANEVCTNTPGSRTCGCAAGYANCDGTAANGCEVNVTANTAHCGACGQACAAGQACTAGACGCAPTTAPAPIHRWTFNDGTGNDSIGNLHLTLYNGASVVGGRLGLDGITQYARTAAMPQTVTVRTLVAWVSPQNLTQRSGGVLAIDTPIAGDDLFDAIVFGEGTPRQWQSASYYALRSPGNNGGALETVAYPTSVMIAIAYAADNSIKIYRNGALYAAYTQGTMQAYGANVAQILLGVRHAVHVNGVGTAAGNDPFFAGDVDEARLYNTALSPCAIAALYAEGPTLCAPDQLSCAGTCVNAQTDRNNCGACGRVCGAIEACVAGVCGQRSCAVAGTPGCGLVAIVGGDTFTVGSNATSSFYGGTPEQPSIAVGSFAMDTYEVTVARFNAWWSVRSRDLATVRSAPIAYPGANTIAWGAAAVAPGAQSGSFNWSPASTTRDAHPMNAVSYWAAQEFCVWDGGRLPTEAEWEFAARGRTIPSEGLVSGRLFPWGNTPPSTSCDRALWRGCGGTDGGGTRRVGSYPTGVSGGLNDMAGNVYEWMADTFQSYRPSWSSNLNPLSNLSLTADRIVRGGSWGDSDPNGLLSVGRFTAPPAMNDNPYVGFRCARALP